MALAHVLARAAQRHVLIERDVVADFGRLADDHAHAVIDEQSLADGRAGVDLDAGLFAGALRHNARQQLHVVLPQPVRAPVPPDRQKPG